MRAGGSLQPSAIRFQASGLSLSEGNFFSKRWSAALFAGANSAFYCRSDIRTPFQVAETD